MRVGFVGAGKVGCSLGRYMVEKNVKVCGYFSRSSESTKESADFTNSTGYDKISDLVAHSDILFLTVSDGAIETVWNSIKELPIKGKIICHCSGALSSKVFCGIEELGAYGFSVHPLYAIKDRKTSYRELHNALFTIEGSSPYLSKMNNFIKSLGNVTQNIDAAAKIKYHTAAVMVSNQVIALAQTGMDMLISCGFAEENARIALNPLMQGNMENIVQYGTLAALTGPVERNDIETIKKHIRCLSPREKKIYCELSKVLLEIAQKKHPQRDYSALEAEMKK
ncbi:MAG: DUF2520 domain-containing protein [Lachnospiraceae bacterium]|nr:DUF2520 domain-containing protein [Lachnospiraceae bacterium]